MTIQNYKEHLENKTEKIPIGGCWIWTGAKHPDGYGSIKYKNQPWKVHRLSYLVYKGEIAESLVLHSCDNPSCINPEHLFLGTASDNMKDMVSKGRKKGGNYKHGRYVKAHNTQCS